jgi:hypothetical protein
VARILGMRVRKVNEEMESRPGVSRSAQARTETQLWAALELTTIPTFRRQAIFTSYAEGWALYSEWLAREMPGTYRDPYSRFGRLGSEIWRAIRLVLDTGLHAKGWSEEQAVECFLANSATTEAQARSEVRRYLVTPGPGDQLQDRDAEDSGVAAPGRSRAR